MPQRLEYTYPVLFSFAINKECTVESQFSHNTWQLQLHPNLSYQAETELQALLQNLQTISPSPETADTRELLYPKPWSQRQMLIDCWLFHGSLWNPADYIRIYTIPQNCKVFLWLAFRERLNTKANMVNKKWSNDPHCPIYPALESADHIILRWRNANNLWKRLGHAFGQKIWNNLWLHPSSHWQDPINKKVRTNLVCSMCLHAVEIVKQHGLRKTDGPFSEHHTTNLWYPKAMVSAKQHRN